MADATTTVPAPICPAAILFATFSLLTALLLLPTATWHARHANVGATSVTLLALLANLLNFTNALLWPRDGDLSLWYDGAGLCDLEVKLQVVMQTAFPASLFCILRALARVLDVRRLSLASGSDSGALERARRKRQIRVDAAICGGFPLAQAFSAWIVQPVRYYVRGIAGCQPADDGSWLAAVLLIGPRLLWTLAYVYFAVLVVVRLLHYRRDVRAMFTKHNTTRGRFTRLYVLCAVCVGGMFPLELFLDGVTIAQGLTDFSWTRTHHPTDYDWNSAILIRSDGVILFDRYIWLAGGVVVFLTFGFGRDAVKMYREFLRAIGLGRVFPVWLAEGRRSKSEASRISGSTSSSSLSDREEVDAAAKC